MTTGTWGRFPPGLERAMKEMKTPGREDRAIAVAADGSPFESAYSNGRTFGWVPYEACLV